MFQTEFLSPGMLVPYVVIDQKRLIDQDASWLERLQERRKERPEEIEEHQNPVVFLITQ